MIHSSDRHRPAALFVNSIKFWGGGEQWFLQCATALAARGYDVAVAGRSGGPFLERIRDAGLRTLPLRMGSDLSAGAFLEIRRWLRERRGARVLCNLGRDVRIAGAAARTVAGSQVLWIMGSILLRERAVDRFWVRRFVDRFVVPSESLSSELKGLGYLGPARIEVLPIGLDLDMWPKPVPGGLAPADWTTEERRTSIVGIFGRLERRKGHEDLLRAWPMVTGRTGPATLWIVGTGGEEKALRETAIPFGNQVKFWGHVADVRSLMRAVDVVVQPSLYEPFGITLLEAMACGKPIVCTKVGGMPEVVSSECAILVPPGDPARLAEAIAGLLLDRDHAFSLGMAGRQRVEETFPLERMIDRLEGILSPG